MRTTRPLNAKLSVNVLIAVSFMFHAYGARAGFGVTPPYVINDLLRRGTQFRQEIMLVRSNADKEIQAGITVDIKDVNAWFSFEPGPIITIPAGIRQIPVTVLANVPQDAEYRMYAGAIRIKTLPKNENGGSVSVAEGSRVDIAITVTDKAVERFVVRSVSVANFNEGEKTLWMYFPGKLRLTMVVENIGNVPTRPAKVLLDIWDRPKRNKLASIQNSNRMEKIEPFSIKTVTAEFKFPYGPDDYPSHYTVYAGDELANEGDIITKVFPKGTVTGDTGYGFMGLPWKDRAILLVFAMSLFAISGYFVRKKLRKKVAIPFS